MSQVTALHRREMILLGAVPTGVTPVMLAVQYKVYVDESEATILVRTSPSAVTTWMGWPSDHFKVSALESAWS